MIKFVVGEPENRLYGMGLSRGNIERMMEGDPIFFDGRPMGIHGHIMIMFGETEEAIGEELEKQGFELPEGWREKTNANTRRSEQKDGGP